MYHAKLSKEAIPKPAQTPRFFKSLNGISGYRAFISQRMKTGMQQKPMTRGAMTTKKIH